MIPLVSCSRLQGRGALLAEETKTSKALYVHTLNTHVHAVGVEAYVMTSETVCNDLTRYSNS